MASLKEKLPQWIGDSFKQENSQNFDNKKIMQSLVEVRNSCLLLNSFSYNDAYKTMFSFYFSSSQIKTNLSQICQSTSDQSIYTNLNIKKFS